MTTLLNILKLIRVWNCLMASAGVWVGAYLAAGPELTLNLLAAMAGAIFVCAAGNVVNDLYGIEGDRVNHPARPLVTGSVSIRAARRIAIAAHLLALVAGALANLNVFFIAAISLVLLYLYNMALKRVPLVGNVVVAVLAGLAFVCGGVAVDKPVFQVPGPLLAAGFAFFFHLVREIIKDTEDMAGDRGAGLQTLPQIIGERAALGLALALFLCLVILTLVPVWKGWFGGAYELLVVGLIDIPLLGLLVWTAWVPSEDHIRWSQAALKAGMAVGLVALVVA